MWDITPSDEENEEGEKEKDSKNICIYVYNKILIKDLRVVWTEKKKKKKEQNKKIKPKKRRKVKNRAHHRAYLKLCIKIK